MSQLTDVIEHILIALRGIDAKCYYISHTFHHSMSAEGGNDIHSQCWDGSVGKDTCYKAWKPESYMVEIDNQFLKVSSELHIHAMGCVYSHPHPLYLTTQSKSITKSMCFSLALRKIGNIVSISELKRGRNTAIFSFWIFNRMTFGIL